VRDFNDALQGAIRVALQTPPTDDIIRKQKAADGEYTASPPPTTAQPQTSPPPRAIAGMTTRVESDR
jgi:hypothetical protein